MEGQSPVDFCAIGQTSACSKALPFQSCERERPVFTAKLCFTKWPTFGLCHMEQLEQVPAEDLWLIADSSDLRKPYAEAMPYLMQVRDLDEQWVSGFCTLNVIGLTPGRRGLLYHRLFSSQAPEFVSEPAEVQEALQTVSQALAALKELSITTN